MRRPLRNYPMNNEALVAKTDNDDFFNTLALQQDTRPEYPKPIYVRLDGRAGLYNELVFNEAEKKQDKIEFQGGEKWEGAVLMVRWFAKSKWADGATKSRRTREFNDFRLDAIEYLEMDFKTKETTVLGKYEDYPAFKQAMKDEFGKAVQEALIKKLPMPTEDEFVPELWGSIYVYHFGLGRIVNLKVKGKSRSELFTYLSSWKRSVNVPSISQVLTEFSAVEFTEPQQYFATGFKAVSKLGQDEQTLVRTAVLEVAAWINSFKEEVVSVNNDGNDVKLDSIPF